MKTSLTVFLFLIAILTSAFGEAIITLNSGEVLQGDILSDTNNVVRMRVYTHNRSISSQREISRSDIQNIRNETPEQAAEREAYFALSKFHLNPDQEQTPDFYNQWIAAFEKFQTDYPTSDKVSIIKQHIETCKAELKHVESGETKFEDQWMSPEKKAPLAKHKEIESLKSKLANLQTQRRHEITNLEKLKGSLAAAQQSLATAMATPPKEEPIFRDRTSSRISGYKTVYPETGGAQSSVAYYTEHVGKAQGSLADVELQINDTQSRISRLEQEYQIALSKSNPPKQVQAQAPVVQAPPSPPLADLQSPPPPPPVVVTPAPWMVRNWKPLAIGSGVLVILLILMYPLKRFQQRSEQIRAECEAQRHIAHKKLIAAFDSIFAEGERPAGPNTPEGDIIPIGKGEDSYGGGRWFVLNDSHIWAVQNNGRDTDNWVYNNVKTKGHGAVGARIPMNTEWADYINTEANIERQCSG